jgi:hypothetical protein
MPNRLWLMWGWLDPKKKPAPRLVVKRQGTYSETNYNLLLDTDPERGFRPTDFGLGQLVGALGGPLPYGPGRLLEEGRFSRLCDGCRKERSSPCHLFVKPWPGGWTREVPFPDGTRSLMQRQPGRCLILAELAATTETQWERRFYELYFVFAFQQAQGHASAALQTAMADPYSAGLPTDVGSEEWTQSLWGHLAATLTVPALLPQTVLNFVRIADLPPDHPDLNFFEGNLERVDFAFVLKGKRHIVEIDGATHRATERSHTRRLRIDRILQDQGWRVHRFSSLQVREAKDFEEFAWELGFPSRLRASLKDSSDVATDDGLQSIDP